MYLAMREDHSDNWQGGYKFFTAKEMTCKCGCGMLPKHSLMLKLDALRHVHGAIAVTSGARCPAHNMKVSSSGRNGPHTTGLAVDVAKSGTAAFKLLEQALELGFTGIGLRQHGDWVSRYIHLDILAESKGQSRPAVWTYP